MRGAVWLTAESCRVSGVGCQGVRRCRVSGGGCQGVRWNGLSRIQTMRSPDQAPLFCGQSETAPVSVASRPISIRSYRDLEVWQAAVELVEQVYRFSATFPKCETYGLRSQVREAAVSARANHAEGQA